MNKSDQLRMERRKKIENRRYFAKLRKRAGTFGTAFAKSKSLGGW